MSGASRLTAGVLTAGGREIRFRFDGRSYAGLEGDTLASALLANGVRVLGRSFKYHRPRGVITCGADEPCALIDLMTAAGREPNVLATLLPLHEGLQALSQNGVPSLRFDVLAVNNLLGRFLPAGFYYKTFMRPAWAWEKVYEPLIRRAAGLGRLVPIVPAHAAPAETRHAHADVLIVGAGAAGLTAAQALGAAGLRVLLAEQDAVLGGGTLLDARWDAWRASCAAALAALPNVQVLTRTAVVGAYGHGVFAALETLAPSARAAATGLRERLHVIRARRVLIATGATERLVAFAGNDRPGVMLAGAAHAYLRRYGVACAQRPVLFTSSDEAYESVFALQAAGGACAAVIDIRPRSAAQERARALGIPVHAGAVVSAVHGEDAVHAVHIAPQAGGAGTELATDGVWVCGGFSPAVQLATQLGASAQWDEARIGFLSELPAALGTLCGAAAGGSGLAAACADGHAAAVSLAASLARAPLPHALRPPADDPARSAAAPLWEVRGTGKAFVDLQNDVTSDDVRLAQREGYEHLEHMKRYTTHGMATDQGRIGGLTGSAVLAAARGVSVAAVGVPKPRPFLQPLPFAALAGAEVREHFKPKRRLPLHEWHAQAGASFVSTGLWLRPLVYSRERGWDPVLAEARNVRTHVGITDVSTLGKLDLQGPDVATFLDFVYANTFSTLPVGRARYGIMLREDGMLLDDGTTTRLGPEHFLVTTTTANAGAVLEHLEFQLQANCAQLRVNITDVADQWAQFAVAGPRARDVIAAVVSGLDVSSAAFPFMAAAAAEIAGIAGRVFRISFSGELAYELAVPARHARSAWLALLQAGEPLGIRPYGLDALNTLRIEKGHVTTAELNGNTSAEDLGFARMLKKQGDFIGRRLSERPGLTDPARLQLVGVRPRDRARRLRNGMQLVSAESPQTSLGYLTSSTPSVELEGWVALALVAGGRQRTGAHLNAVSPVHGESLEVELSSPHFIDPENLRVRA